MPERLSVSLLYLRLTLALLDGFNQHDGHEGLGC